MGKVRALYNDDGIRLNKALPSYPVELIGLSGAPESGDKLVVVDSESRAREVTQYRSRRKRIEENSSLKIINRSNDERCFRGAKSWFQLLLKLMFMDQKRL